MKKIRLFLLLAVLCTLALPGAKVQSAAPSPYDLIAAVNELRANQGVPTVEIDGSLMASAQGQSDYLASAYGTSFPSNGHLDANGTQERERAIAAGFPLGPGGWIDECWAVNSIDTSISDIIYGTWSDATHWNIMIYPGAKYIGVGITEVDGFVYYILDMAGAYTESNPSSGVASTIPTTAVTAQVAPVQVASPNADGKIIHVVKNLQALWSIAAAYDTTPDQIKALNGLTSDIITVGQELLIQVAYTPTPSPTATLTPRPPTRTPIPQQTAQPVATLEQGKENNGGISILNLDRKTMGLALILICGIGLALMIFGSASKDKKPPKEDL